MAGPNHEINTGNTRPVHQALYRSGPHERRLIGEEIERMLQLTMMQPSSIPWSSLVEILPKHDGSTRFCIDHLLFNALSVRDSFRLPRMDDAVDSLGDAKLFQSIDAHQGFLQIPISDNDVPKTAFTTHKGLYEFVRMPFGLRNANATFQRNIDIILSRVKWCSCLCYPDLIIVFFSSFGQHLNDVE